MDAKKLLLVGVPILVGLSSGAGCASEAKEWKGRVLKNDLVELTVVPQIGGRVIQYKLGDYGFFWENPDLVNSTPPASGLGPEDAWLNYGGAKLWPAPQGWDNDRQWPGPPDAVLDGQPYSYEVLTGGKEVQSVRLTSREDQRSGIRFSRIITIRKGTTRVIVDATMKNIDSKPRQWGIWDHIQFDAANRHGQGYNENFWGYCLLNEQSKFYKGYSVQYGLVNNPTFKPDYENGMMRVHYQHLVGKAGVDSPGGWVATVDATDGYAFVHQYTYEPQKPYPEDSSVEFWFNGMGQFGAWGKLNTMGDKPKDIPYVMESEIISPFARLEPGEQYTFRYAWCSAKILSGMGVVSCNDMGVLCGPIKADLKDGKLLLSGSGGVFYEGTLSITAIDKQERHTVVLDDIAVTPLEPVDFKAVAAKPARKKVPDQTARIVIEIVDKEGRHIGRFAEANISQ